MSEYIIKKESYIRPIQNGKQFSAPSYEKIKGYKVIKILSETKSIVVEWVDTMKEARALVAKLKKE